jgi:prostaglandin-endoperoxide synthase 2
MPTDRSRTTTNHEIDLCPLYGRTRAQADQLRLKSRLPDEFGRLKSQIINGEEYPPFLYANGSAEPKPEFGALDPPLFSPGPPSPHIPPPPQDRLETIFAVGGDRVNATPFAAMMNTLLLREHNRVARELARQNPAWDDERVFQTARNIMIPIFINIVVAQYINHITPFPFSIKADPSVAWKANWNRPNWITCEFSLLNRWHSLMPDEIEWPDGAIPTAAFSLDNAPLLRVGLDAAFSAAARQRSAALGPFNTTPSLWPVEALAILQARRNRIDTYNRYRVQFGMHPAKTFADISKDPAARELLERLYETPDNVEFYPGLFAEDRVTDSPLPELLMRMVAVDAFSQALTNPLL